jgi:YVTN family beta-propeller protein
LAFLIAFIILPILAAGAGAQETLVNGKKITVPPLGAQFGVGSLPMNMIASPDGRYAIVSDMGYRESLWSLSTSDGSGISHVDYSRGRGSASGLYYGLAIDKNGTVYASEGAAHKIDVVKLTSDGTLTQSGTIQTRQNEFPAGLALDSRGNLYMVSKEYYSPSNSDVKRATTPSGLAIYDPATGQEIGYVAFPSLTIPSALGPISPPGSAFAVVALDDGSKVFVSSQRDGLVYDVNATTPTSPKVAGQIATGSHPDSLLLSADQARLYVANAGSDTISVLDTKSDKVLDTILLRPDAIRGLPGATPTGLALSPDQKTLYVTLGDMNAVAVVDLGKDRLTGYIPAGWYPSAVVATADGKLMVANAYGTKTRNPNGTAVGTWGTYVLSVIEGSVSTLPIPTSDQLSDDTRQVLANNRVSEARISRKQALAAMGLKDGQIKHVIYIIKENRTYDQVLGDEPNGNGDASLVMFGKSITPNLHALVERFVLLDNFYDCGEVSGIGWPWSTQGLASEYVVKNVPYNYSGRMEDYDFEGQVDGYPVGGFPAKDPYGAPLSAAFPNGAKPIPDVSMAPGGHIWDEARKAGLSYRNYGFFYTFGVNGVIPDNYPDSPGIQPAGHDLGGISDIDFRRFDNSYPDSDAPAIYYARDQKAGDLYPTTAYGHYKAQSRFAEWKREFDEMLAKDPSGGVVPALMTVRMPHDHTEGARSNGHSPQAEVADNDYGVGQIVDTISHSPIWKSTAIFVIEDDAQDGQDHVDCHRSICFVISPWIKKNSVDHAFYNTDSVLRTMELILGLPAMSQYDAVATPIRDWDSAASNDDPYAAILPDESIIAQHNLSLDLLAPTDPRRKLALLSDKMDFTHPDSAPAQELNQILWQTVKGVGTVSPTPRFTLEMPAVSGSDDGDGDD